MAKKQTTEQVQQLPLSDQKTPRFKTPYNAELFPVKGERNRLPSLTIPDQTMGIREIVKRFANGLPISGQKVPLYEETHGEDARFLPDPKTMDLAEREEFVKAIDEEIRQINRQAAEKQQAAAKYAREQHEARIKKAAEQAVKASWWDRRHPDANRSFDDRQH